VLLEVSLGLDLAWWMATGLVKGLAVKMAMKKVSDWLGVWSDSGSE